MEIKEITDKEIWESFILSCEDKTFLHSWNWGEFNKMMGDKIWRLGMFDNSELLAVALIIKVKAKRGNFLFCPQGPIIRNFKFQNPNDKQISNSKIQIFKTLIEKLKEIAREEKVSFIRISPILEDTEENKEIFRELGFRPAPIHMHAETIWTIDVTPSEEEILANMRKTTRYCIKKAQKELALSLSKRGLEIIKSNKIEDLEKFNALYQETAKRQRFVPFSREYLKNQFLAFSSDDQINVFLARYRDKIISGAVVVYYGDSGFYHHGASSLEYSNVPASYLLQWEAIKEAKRRGCKFYNFWGIAPVSMINNQLSVINKLHPWAGLTLFKTGFGGFQTNYMHAQDLPLKKSYWITYIIEMMRKNLRHL